jgi:hypothetical protein
MRRAKITNLAVRGPAGEALCIIKIIQSKTAYSYCYLRKKVREMEVTIKAIAK